MQKTQIKTRLNQTTSEQIIQQKPIQKKKKKKSLIIKILLNDHPKKYSWSCHWSNEVEKSTLLKLLALRKIPVPKNIDVLLVEQEVDGDDRTALETVISANEELAKLQKEVAFLQNSFSAAKGENEDFNCNGDDVGEKLADLWKVIDLIAMGSDDDVGWEWRFNCNGVRCRWGSGIKDSCWVVQPGYLAEVGGWEYHWQGCISCNMHFCYWMNPQTILTLGLFFG